jgi:hypothetical protein
MGAHNNWGVPVNVLTSVSSAPWCAVRNPLFYPPIELHGHRGSAWRVVKYVPLVTDFMGRMYISHRTDVVLKLRCKCHLGNLECKVMPGSYYSEIL